jgi:choline-sulfatase
MNRRPIKNCILALSIVLLKHSSNLAAETPQPKPNVLVLLTDDQQFDSVAALGNPTVATPNLDRIAANGLVFRNAYIMGGWASAVCLPSRTMIMTGRTLWHVPGLAGNTYPANIADKTLPVAFNSAGYDTLRSGKQSNTYIDANTRFGTNIYHEVHDSISSSRFVDDAITFLTNRVAAAKTNAFLMYLGFDHPHDPRNAPQSYLDHYHASAPNPNTNTPINLLPPLPAAYLPKHPFDNGELVVRDETSVEGVLTNRDERTIRNEIGKTYATIEYLDAQVGRLLAKLDELGLTTNTFIVFASDNGVAIGRHGLIGKQNVYEHALRVPLIISGPGINHDNSDAFVYLYDLFPTLCDLTGVAAPDTVEGLSLKPILLGQTSAVRASVLGSFKALQRAVRVDDWKLIHYPNIDRTQLFDLASDPHETNDLSNLPQHADRIQQLAGQLVALQAQYGDHQLSNALGRVGANIARQRPAIQSSTFGAAYAAANAVDGPGSTLTSFSHTASNDANAWLLVDLQTACHIQEVLLHNREDCCQGRLRDITVEILDASTNVVAASPLLNPDNVLGGGVTVYSTGPAKLAASFTNLPPAGRFVRVRRQGAAAPGPAPSDQFALALDEVQVFADPTDAIPIINVTAGPSTLSETGGPSATLIFTRTGNTNTAVTVSYTVTGSASNGVDFTALTGSFTISAGGVATNLTVTAIPDDLAEGPETITVTLNADPFYEVGITGSATLTIFDTPIDNWRYDQFGTDANTVTIAGNLADPDGDGAANLLEYALRLNPNVASVVGLPVYGVESNHLTLTFTKWLDATDITYLPEAADAPGGSWLTNDITQTVISQTATTQVIKATDSIFISDSLKRFLRLKVTYP